MGDVLGEILPLAVGIAISPVPIIATILMLLSPRATRTSLGFLAGWILGIIVTVVVFALLSAVVVPRDENESAPIAGTVTIVLGVLLVLLAARSWRSRPRGDEDPPLPGWMSAIDTMGAGRALTLGLLLAAVNPKNLLLGAGAGLAIGGVALSVAETSIAVTVFTVIASVSILLPVVLYLAARTRMAGPLESLRSWLTHNNATVMAVLMLVIGVVLIGKGIERF